MRCFCYSDKWNRCAVSKSDGEGGTSNRFHRIFAIGYLSRKRGSETDCRYGRVSGGNLQNKRFLRILEPEESDAELERLQLTLNELLEDARGGTFCRKCCTGDVDAGQCDPLHEAHGALATGDCPSVSAGRLNWCRRRHRFFSDFIQEVSFFAKADQGCQPAYKKRMNISELTTGIIEGQIRRLQEADEPVQIGL